MYELYFMYAGFVCVTQVR